MADLASLFRTAKPAPAQFGDYLLGGTPDADPAPYGTVDPLTRAPGYDPLGPYLKQGTTSLLTGQHAPPGSTPGVQAMGALGLPARVATGAYDTIANGLGLLEHGGTREQFADNALTTAGMMTVPTDAGAVEVAGIGGKARGALKQVATEQPLGDLGAQANALLAHGDLLDAMATKAAGSGETISFQPPPVSTVDPAASAWSLYHGSPAGTDFTANGGRFDPYYGNKPGGQEAGALFMSPSPEEASQYAGASLHHDQEAGPRVFPLSVKPGNTALFDLPHLLQNDPAFRDEIVRNLTPDYGADAARQKMEGAVSEVARQRDLNAMLAQHGLPAQPPTVHWMSGATDAAVKRAQSQGLDTAIIRGLSESNGGDQIVALKPGTVFSRTSGEQLYNGGPSVPQQRTSTIDDDALLRWIQGGGV